MESRGTPSGVKINQNQIASFDSNLKDRNFPHAEYPTCVRCSMLVAMLLGHTQLFTTLGLYR